jgi:hypothetical protein
VPNGLEMTPISVPTELMNDCNRSVLAHIADKSAHSDISDALVAAVKPLGDARLFCPDWQQYRYVVASTRCFIFGFAIGMNTIAFRLDDRMRSRALATGGEAYPECGPDWVAFLPFRDDWPRVDLEFWALKAYCHARESAP